MSLEVRVCTRCVYDTTIPEIQFDESGVCQYCCIHDKMAELYPLDGTETARLQKLVDKVKRAGKNNRYDCVVGVSGGTDSTYTLLKVVELGLRPLAVHFDNGWNSNIAVKNIQAATKKLNVDLETHVADWEEFKDLQISFLKASTSDAEIPTDVSIHAVLHEIAAKLNIKYVFIGHSFRTEGIVPKTWTYMDGKYINSVHKIFGSKKISSFPNLTLWKFVYYSYIKCIKSVAWLNYFNYEKSDAGKILEKEVGWTNTGGHHHENMYTIFFQSYYLPRKFGIDKRKLALSAKIRSGKINREEALNIIHSSPYPLDMADVDYTVSKLGLSKEEFEAIMKAPRKSFRDYPTYYPFLLKLKWPIYMAMKLKLVPEILYFKIFN